MSSKKLSLSDAIKIYSCSDDDGKALLEKIYSKNELSRNVLDSDLTFEKVCEEMGYDPIKELPYPNPTTNRQRYINACVMLDIISEYLLQGVILNWSNSNQKKWFPWFDNYKPGAGFRFVVSVDGWTSTGAYGGARLCVDTKEKSDYFGTQFLGIWNDFLNPIK